MPASSTGILRAFSLLRIVSSVARVCFGSAPRNASFAPSSTITASVASPTDQSSRASPPAPPPPATPDPPACGMMTFSPLALSAISSLAGSASCAPRPNPALSESPSTTIRTRRLSAAETAGMPRKSAEQTSVKSAKHAVRWTGAPGIPYDPLTCPLGRERKRMNDTTDAAPAAISLSAVNLSLGRGAARGHILKDIDLHIGTGEAVGLVGPSGSGRPAQLMVGAGMERPDTGRVQVAGHDLGTLDEDALARFRGKNVGIVFQNFNLIPTMTALENVAVPLELAGEADAVDKAAAELASVGLRDRVNHYPAELSGGEQQRVALARALAPHPAILVADEPTGNLDEATGREIIELLFAGQET